MTPQKIHNDISDGLGVIVSTDRHPNRYPNKNT